MVTWISQLTFFSQNRQHRNGPCLKSVVIDFEDSIEVKKRFLEQEKKVRGKEEDDRGEENEESEQVKMKKEGGQKRRMRRGKED